MATIDGARSLWQEHRTGSLTPGKAADLVLLRTDRLHLTPLNDPIAAVVTSAHAGDVDTVLVAGRVRKRRGALVGVDLPHLRAQADASRDYLMATSGYARAA